MRFHYSITDRIIFYVRYFVLKVFFLWFEVRRPKLKMFLYEMLYSASKFFNYAAQPACPFTLGEVETVFGRFTVREHSADAANVSPAFERRDVDVLLQLIRRLSEAGQNVLFLDVGADLGTFSVAVGNSFWDDYNVSVMAFEPAPSSYSLLTDNIQLNGLGNKVTTYNIALHHTDGMELDFAFNPVAPGTSAVRQETEGLGSTDTVKARTLDAVLSESDKEFSAAVLKIDVEGMEADVLRGAGGLLGSEREVYLLVEDFVEQSIVGYLEDIGARFLQKRTPYNSWWIIGGEGPFRS